MSDAGARRRGHALSDAQRLAWLRLIRSENVGPTTFRMLVNRFGGAEAALEALPELAARGGSKRRITVTDKAAAEAELALAARLGARFVGLGEPDYPSLLRLCEGAPPLVALMGDAALFERPSVAIVGARDASAAGTRLARQLVADLGAAGFVVVSGLARGIDTAAHEAALSTGTIGVFAGGLDKPYPRENRPLMRRIVDGGGCLLSEMPFGWEPRAVDFPRRNRIVAGLSLGLLVVEAAVRSGSLISARLAGELGRLVFAIPGSPADPRAGGTNRLLKDGAILVTEASDVIDALRPLGGPPALPPDAREEPPLPAIAPPGEEERDRIVLALGSSPVRLDDLVAHVAASPSAVQLVLLELELAGRLERHVDGRVSLLF